MVHSLSGHVYERILSLCPPLEFPPVWDFLPPGVDCRGPVQNPDETLATLAEEYAERHLEDAGVVELTPQGDEFRLLPELCNPVGAVVALRKHPRRRPFALLTARGCLGKRSSPLLAALSDAWTAGGVTETGVLFTASPTREAALPPRLAPPATLCLGLPRLSPNRLRALDAA